MKENDDIIKTFPPINFVKTKYTTATKLPYGKYLVVLNNIKVIPLIYNNTGWSNYNDHVTDVYLPAFQ